MIPPRYVKNNVALVGMAPPSLYINKNPALFIASNAGFHIMLLRLNALNDVQFHVYKR